jgi:hypothetical protein
MRRELRIRGDVDPASVEDKFVPVCGRVAGFIFKSFSAFLQLTLSTCTKTRPNCPVSSGRSIALFDDPDGQRRSMRSGGDIIAAMPPDRCRTDQSRQTKAITRH